MLDPNLLLIFLTAAETLNFSRAAERLHLTQPSITQRMRSLERQLGSPLFIRRGNHLELTEAGQALVPLARQMVAVAMRTEEVMESISGELAGQLILGCSTTPGKYLLPVLLADFMQRYPRVQAVCNVGSRMQALEALEQGRVHLAMTSAIDNLSEALEFRHFYRDAVSLIVPLGHRWALTGEIIPEELRQERFILREETAGTFCAVRTGLSRLGLRIDDLNTILTLGNSEAIAISVQQGLGVGFVSDIVVRRIAEDKVRRVRVRGLELHQDIYLCRHRLRPSLRLQSAFWNFALETQNQGLALDGLF